MKAFWIEIAVMAIIPLVLMSMPQFRRQRDWQWATAAIAVSGVVLNRIDVGGLADSQPRKRALLACMDRNRR